MDLSRQAHAKLLLFLVTAWHQLAIMQSANAVVQSLPFGAASVMLPTLVLLVSSMSSVNKKTGGCRRQTKSRLAPTNLVPVRKAETAGGSNRQTHSMVLGRTGSTTLSNHSAAVQSQWESPPVKGPRPSQKVRFARAAITAAELERCASALHSVMLLETQRELLHSLM